MEPKIDPNIDVKIDAKNDDFLDPLSKSADPPFLSDLAPPPLPNLPPILQVKAPRINKTSIASLSCAELRSASRHLQVWIFEPTNPPTPPGSTGCEIASGCPPSVPPSWDSGGPAPPRGVPPPRSPGGSQLLNPGGQKAPAGRPSVIPKAKYMTLGPKFFCCSKMTVTRRRKHLFQ